MAMAVLVVEINGRVYSRQSIGYMARWHAVLEGTCGVLTAVQLMESCRFQSLDVREFLGHVKKIDVHVVAGLLKS